MISITPTQFRNGLFAQIDCALKGIPVHIRTRKGNAVLISEKAFEKASARQDRQEISGRIIGSLDDADQALKQHLVLPE
jgi:PHD/YefM family antitoxin component YafN of YafNO toxin-antitoxin module